MKTTNSLLLKVLSLTNLFLIVCILSVSGQSTDTITTKRNFPHGAVIDGNFSGPISVSGQATDTTTTKRNFVDGAEIGGKFSGPISKSELLNSEKLTLSEQLRSTYEIASFRLTRIRKGESPVEIDNDKNGDITNEMKELINASIAGDKLYFEYIKCRNKDGTKRSLGSISFIIE